MLTGVNNCKVRIYGNPPFCYFFIHGGPGATGDLAVVAEKAGEKFGVVEPLFTGKSITNQLDELKEVIDNHNTKPVVLVGHSWGAWLAYLYTAKHPEEVRKLIILSSGPFSNEYVEEIGRTRMDRLEENEKLELSLLLEKLKSNELNKNDLKNLSLIFRKSDIFHPIDEIIDSVDFNAEIYTSLWPEAAKLRDSGQLLEEGQNITCPVVAIHGLKDPHPYGGVEEPLSQVIQDFSFILLEKCGHYPWNEKYARERFYNTLFSEMEES